MSVPKKDVEPEIIADDDEEQSLPEAAEAEAGAGGEEEDGSLAAGRAAILRYAKTAPSQPGVYRMIDARGDVLYVGKAKNVRNRVRAYARPAGLDTRIERMIAAMALASSFMAAPWGSTGEAASCVLVPVWLTADYRKLQEIQGSCSVVRSSAGLSAFSGHER